MWFWFAVIALLCWSGSDLFSKIGCRDPGDKTAYLKMVIAVGAVFGLHAAYGLLFKGVELDMRTVLIYLPVSALYIASMTIGYLGLRYIELSISSPICNSSGAIVAVLTFLTAGISEDLPPVALAAVALVCIGVIALGVTEAREDEDLRKARQDASNYHYAKSFLAILIPIIYCILDALGTFADSRVLEVLDEEAANTAYELTFLLVGIVCAVYVYGIRREKFSLRRSIPRTVGGVFETAGQFCYVYALADTEHVAFSAPIISSYCVLSVLWSRIFLKEKLSWKHYICILLVVIAIVILGILDI